MARERKPQKIAEELKRMEQEYEPLLPVEKRLIRLSISIGIAALIIFVVLSELLF